MPSLPAHAEPRTQQLLSAPPPELQPGPELLTSISETEEAQHGASCHHPSSKLPARAMVPLLAFQDEALPDGGGWGTGAREGQGCSRAPHPTKRGETVPSLPPSPGSPAVSVGPELSILGPGTEGAAGTD